MAAATGGDRWWPRRGNKRDSAHASFKPLKRFLMRRAIGLLSAVPRRRPTWRAVLRLSCWRISRVIANGACALMSAACLRRHDTRGSNASTRSFARIIVTCRGKLAGVVKAPVSVVQVACGLKVREVIKVIIGIASPLRRRRGLCRP